MSTILKNYGNENILEFIQGKIKNNNNVEKDILDKITYVEGKIIEDTIIEGTIIEGDIIEDRSSQGFYYERLWDICIKFGATELTLPSIKDKLQTYHIMNKNPNNDDISIENSNCWDNDTLNKTPGGYLSQKVRSGNSGGYSDITFMNTNYNDSGTKIGEEELYFISVKYFKDEKEIAKYDIGKLCALVEKHKATNRTIKIFIFVKNKQDAIKKFEAQNSSSNILIKYINPYGKYENIYDLTDLQNAYFKLKKILEQFNYLESLNDISNFEKDYLKVLKEVFIPRFHQKLFVGKIDALIVGGEKNILVGAIPRSGKSYVMAGAILEYIKTQELLQPTKKLKFLLMTPAPNETFGEYEAIFNKYIEFNGIDVVTYKEGISIKEICKNANNHCIIIISKQKLGWSAGSKGEALLAKVEEQEEQEEEQEDEQEEQEDEQEEQEDEQEEQEGEEEQEDDKAIKKIEKRITQLFGTNPNIDVMFLDEAHFGMSTTKAKKIVNVLNSTIANTVKIYVTATYNKPLQAYGVTKNCIITWGLNDIQIMKTINDSTIKNNAIFEQFGKTIYESALEYFGDKTGLTLISKFQKDYSIFPKPYLITSLWDKEFLSTEKLKIGTTEFDWDMNKLFLTNGDSTTFANVEQIKEMMRYYFGYPDKKDKKVTYIEQTFYRKRGIIPRIQNICLNKCRTLQQQHKTSQLWFLPVGTSKIKNKVIALINLLTSNEFKDIQNNYHFFIAIDIEDKAKAGKTIDGVTYMNDPHNIKVDIEKVEKNIKTGKIKQDNLIILAGQRLQLGISLRNVDIVTLWNSTSSADAIFQMLFRSMTEVDGISCEENEYCAEKKFGFMVDMNPQRSFLNVNLFDTNDNKKDVDEKQKYRLITDLINIDEDVFRDQYENDESGRTKFVKDLFDKLYESWNKDVENIKKVITAFRFDMTKLEALQPLLQKINIDKSKTMKDDIYITEGAVMFDPGKKKEKIGETKMKDEKKTIKATKFNLKEAAQDVIGEFISLLNIFTLYMDSDAQCILTDSSKLNAQITLIPDIDILKNEVFKDKEIKENFLKILNGRLTGNANEPYLENVIDGILDAIDNSDAKLIMNKIISSQKKQYYTINEPTELLEYIDFQLKPKPKEKKENGEVFTPLTLVNEMLTKLDDTYIKEHGKSIFTEVDFKWFDPAVGIGNFPIILYERLMKGLVESIKDEEQRRKHILENMIYASELTPKNVFIYKKIFCDDKYKLNIYKGDTLKMDVMKIWGLQVNSFDVVLGNPPYNKGGIWSYTKKTDSEKREVLWMSFIKKSFVWLKPGGFLVFITPLYWLKLNIEVHTMMLEKYIVWLKLWDDTQSRKSINADIPISLFILQNVINKLNKKTEIISEIKRKKLITTSFEYLNQNYSIPLAYHSIFDKLIRFIEKQNCSLEYKTKVVKSSGTKSKVPLEYKLEDMWAIDTYTLSEGILVKKAIELHPDANKRKLIIANKRGFKGAFIDEGKLSLTGTNKYYIIGDNLEVIKKILEFNINIVISDFLKYSQSFLDKEAFKYIPDIRKLGINDITEDEFYKLIGLTHQEINQIKNPLNKELLEVEVEEEEEQEVEEEEQEQEVEDTKVKTQEVEDTKVKTQEVEDTKVKTQKRCPNGTRRNKITGECEPITSNSLKKTGGKKDRNKKSRNKKSRNKKSRKQKYKKQKYKKSTSKKTRKLKYKK